jgi:hypothetical protein
VPKLTTLIILTCLIFGVSNPAQANSSTRVVDMEVTHNFGELIGLHATIESDIQISEIIVFIQSEDDIIITTDLLIPTSDGEVSYTLNVAQTPLRAFSEISIWFEFELDDGSSVTSEVTNYVYSDNRFEWQYLRTDEFAIHWYQDDPGLGQKILNTAYEGLDRIQNQINVPNPEGIRIFAYASVVEMQDTLMFSGGLTSWVAGHADADLGVIVISLPPGPDQILEIRRQIPHELTHILLYRKLGSGYTQLPRWLNEGLASTAELFPNPDYQLLLNKAYEREVLIPISYLCTSFPVDAANFQLSYAESFAFTWYLQRTYGNKKMDELIQAYADGMDCTQGAQSIFEVSLSDLEAGWRQEMFNENLVMNTWLDTVPLMIVFGVVFIVPFGLMAKGVGKRSKATNNRRFD